MDTDLDTLAGALRERLLAAAGEGDDGAEAERIRALVDREAGVLDAGARAGLAARIAEMIRKATEEAQRGIEPPGGRG